MTENRIYCGKIIHKSITYSVFWDPIDKSVWVKDKNGKKINIGDARTVSQSEAIDSAEEMLKIYF